jgi:hypothetical protein
MMARASIFRDESRWGYQHWRADIPVKKAEWERHWVVIRKGRHGMELNKRQVPAPKWNFNAAMEYSYPPLSFDVGESFKKGPQWKNPERDHWMEGKIEKEGMRIPKRILPERG